jgi:putative SOS response-associated peptidase YedK
MRWGLVLFWAKDEETAFINAKDEIVAVKPVNLGIKLAESV